MINAWSLLYDELYGDDKMTDNKITPRESDEYDIPHSKYWYDWDRNGLTENPFEISIDSDVETFSVDTTSYDFNVGSGTTESAGSVFTVGENCDTLNISIPDYDLYSSPKPGIEVDYPRKYKEDESIKALQDYISTTYGGHYTSKENNVQTLDLIESVGDAESFCRSNAIKYLSRYDKKGQAKRDILKALHYSLLLYHFSGQLNETPTRGYETF